MKYKTIVLTILLVMFFLAASAPAIDSDIVPFYSITSDEGGNRLFTPTFVLAEPVMKEIYVISRSKIFIFTDDFYNRYTFGKNRGIENPLSVAVDAEGYVYVAQSPSARRPEKRISVYNPSFLWERDIVLKGFEGDDSFSPYRVAVDGKGRIYVAGTGFPGVPVIDKQGKVLAFIQPVDEEEKVDISDVAVGKDGKIYLLSVDKSHVYVYNENMEFMYLFGQKGGSPGKLSRPVGVDVDNVTGRAYVVDYLRHSVLAYDDTGRYLFEFAGMGWGPGWLQYPSDLAVDSEGRVIVADTFNNKVEVFKTIGREQ